MSQDTPETPLPAGSDDTTTTPAQAPVASTPTPVIPATVKPVATPAAPAAPAAQAAPATPVEYDELDEDFVETLALETAEASLPARLGAEALGAFFLVLVGLGVSLYTGLSGAGSLGVALGWGLALVAGMVALGHVSGGHFNPAVTIGAAVAGRLAWRDVLPYWLAQIIGGALAASALFLTIPKELPALIQQGVPAASAKTFFALTANGYGHHSTLWTLSNKAVAFGFTQALLIEVLATALLVAVVLGSPSRRVPSTLAPFAIGLSYAVLVLVAAPITGGGLNPARSTAAAIFSGSAALGQVWLFWVAPVVGAVFAALLYRAFSTDQGGESFAGESETLLLEEDLLVAPRGI